MTQVTRWPAAVLFDLDGTLADSAPDIAAAVDHVLVALGFESAGVERIRGWVGDGVGPLLERALHDATGAAADPQLMAEALKRFDVVYLEGVCVHSALYPGIRELLAVLGEAKVPLGVVTNKPTAFSLALLKGLGIADSFGIVVCGDTLKERKPHALPVRHACERLGQRCEDSVLVGDSPNDALSARAAGTGAILMSWGYNTGVDLSTLDADQLLDDAGTLEKALRNWQSRSFAVT